MANEKRLAHAWEEIRARNLDEAERIFEEETVADPANVDAWNGLGAVRFEKGDLDSSLASYTRAHDIVIAAHGGAIPDRLPWITENKPALRAIHGAGLVLFRMGRFAEAKKRFALLLRLNPDDNQGAAMLLRDVERKARLWNDDTKDA